MRLLPCCIAGGLLLGLMSLALRLGAAAATAQPAFLATGVRLDPVGAAIELGSMPIGMALSPARDKLVVVLSGWREQGLQVVDLKTRRVTQTVQQEAAFYGVTFSPDGRMVYVSGGNDDSVFCYAWDGSAVTLQRKIVLGQPKADKTGSRYPAGVAVSRDGRFLYVAENVADTLAVVDLQSALVVSRFGTDRYPYAVETAADGHLYVSAWGGNTVSVFRSPAGGALIYERRITVGRRPSALLVNRAASRLYVALAGSDQVAVVDTRQNRVVRTLRDSAPGAPDQGSTPDALALSADETKLYVAEGDNNAVAVFALAAEESASHHAGDQPVGRIPSDWYPTAILDADGQLLVLNGKGHGSHANPDGPTPGEGVKRPLGYTLGQLSGTLRVEPDTIPAAQLASLSARVAAANNWGSARKPTRYPPFRHVLYIIKENRTYDQVFGDLKEGDGDPQLVFFGRESTPNHRALALRFGLFDRFFTSGEVSSLGHIWSTAAYVTDYGEKTVPSGYSSRRGAIDGEEIDEPLHGFLWSLAAQHGVSFRDYGEMVAASEGWPVTQRQLGPDVSAAYPAFNLTILDQARADAWIAEFTHFVKDGNLPQLEIMHLPNDHTAGGRAGFRTPRALVADNDLALGRIIEALSRSPFWRDTIVFVVEDDSQSGPDHVDSHRAPFLVISAYNRPGTIHRFVNTTDVVAAIEDILSLDRLSKYDYFSRSLADLFAPEPDLTPYAAVRPEADLEERNPLQSAAARLSEGIDLSAADRVDVTRFNRILWLIAKGGAEPPPVRSRAPLEVFQLAH